MSCGQVRKSVPTTNTKESVLSHLEENGIEEGVNTVLYKKVLDRVRAMPYIAIYDAKQKLLYEKLGYGRKLVDEIDKVLSGNFEPPKKNLRMLPVKTLDGKWFNPERLSPAKFYIYEFWAIWCEPCTRQMLALQKYLAGSPHKEDVHLIRVFCGGIEFSSARQATSHRNRHQWRSRS